MANWSTPEQAEKAIAEEYERKRLWEKWKSGELYEERKQEREVLERVDRIARRTMWPSLQFSGHTYYSIPQLAVLRMTSYNSARIWARRRPSQCITWRNHLYCRHEDSPSEGIAPALLKDGEWYFSMPALARRRKIATISAYSWAENHPELTIRHRGRLYCRDEAYRPRSAPPSIEREGKEYVSVPELARRRVITRVSARAWARRHPELTLTVHGHLFVRDEDHSPKKIPAVVWKGTVPYFSVAELARRRGTRTNSANGWVKNHPHLAMKIKGYWYARDEEWNPRPPRETPARRPVTHPALMAGAARRRGG